MPNCITLLGLICGLIATVFAFQCNIQWGGLIGYQWCWIFIGGSIICDFCDGLAARVLDAYSDLGKNLDSLSDLVSFGIAPCFLTFNLINVYHPDWNFVTWLPLLIPITGAFRLAMFNIDPNQSTTFSGLPIPANALFWVGFSPLLIQPGQMPAWIAALAILAVAFLMVTPLPMFSLKFKNFKPTHLNIIRWTQIVVTAILCVFLHIQGIMWAIVFYIFISMCSFFVLQKNK